MKRCVLLLMSWVGWLQAAELPAEPVAPMSLTEQWLQMQREGEQASTYVQTVTVIEQEKAHDRWLKTYDHAIPDQFEVEKD